MARPEQVLILEPQHELKFRGKRGGPGNGREEEEGVPLSLGWETGHRGVSLTKPGRSRTIRFDNVNEFRTLCKDGRSSDTSAPS